MQHALERASSPELPRLFNDEIRQIRARLAGGAPRFRDAWSAFARERTATLENASAWLERLERERARAVETGGNRWYRFGNSLRSLTAELAGLAAVRRVSGENGWFSDELRLAQRVFAEPEWRAQGRLSNPEWLADLWTGDIACNMSLWLSWSQDELDARTLAHFAGALGAKGIEPILAEWVNPRTRIHALDTMGHNWWSVIIAGAGLAALTLGRMDDVKRMRDGLLAWMEFPGNVLQNKTRTFGRDGGFVEPPSYCDYALENFLYFAFSLQRLANDNTLLTHPALRGLPDWYLAHLYPRSPEGGWRYVNFGDCSQVPQRLSVWLGLARALGDLRMAAAFHAARRGPERLGDFLWYLDEEPDVPVRAPRSAVYRDAGSALLRSDDGEHLFAVRAGEVWNHNHRDTGHFVFYSGGKGWILDPGMVTYSRSEYRSYLVTPCAHNVILGNGEGVPERVLYEGTHVNGSFPVFWEHANYRYLLVDAVGPYLGVFDRFYRHVLWLDGVGVVIVDDVRAPRPSRFAYLIHPIGKLLSPEGTAPNGAGRFVITQGGDARAFSLYCSSPVVCVAREGIMIQPESRVKEDAPLPTATYFAFETQAPEERVKFVSFVGFSDRPVTRFTRVNETLLQLDITAPGDRWTVWVNERADGRVMHRNSLQTWGDIHTDAFIVTHRHVPATTYLHNGSFLRQSERSHFESWIKADATVTDSPLAPDL